MPKRFSKIAIDNRTKSDIKHNMSLTPRQRETLQWIESYMRENLCAPTLREIAYASGCAHTSARGIVLALAGLGALTYEHGAPRSIRLIGVQPWPRPKTAAEAAAARNLVYTPAPSGGKE